MKILIKVFSIVACILVIGVASMHFLPVSWDAGACAGGFKTYIYQKNIDELASLYAGTHNEYKTVLAKRKLSEYDVSWNGRYLYLDAVFDVSDSDNKRELIFVEFVGKRYWTEKYAWKEL